ncbi:MAG TPA: murein biosynthesis integral membrane protein MurJ [Candidatus Acidoferrum sp.]|nr:murein biosynthesis integral membrane protein MurJ [Candidatus Acidoferrum sp.]
MARIEVDIAARGSCNEMTESHASGAPKPIVTTSQPLEATRGGARHHAVLVAAGILLSRIAGLIRERVFAHYFGNSDAADAFKAAFRIPNFLQNMFGEGVLSASFIPVYANLLARKDDEEARRTAGAVAALLALTTSVIVLVGVITTPYLIDAIAGGFSGEKRELTIRLVRILFPSAGLLVFSAWCLGVLNSHKRFFLSYVAPVVWNAALIGAMWGWGGRYAQYPLAQILAWGSVVGSALQVLVQLPVVMRLLKTIRLSLNYKTENVSTVISNFIPVFVGRGVVQISAYVDTLLASWLPMGAVAGLSYAQILYLLPVSLFGMSISASELPHMSGTLGNEEEIATVLRRRLNSGLRQIAMFVVPSVAAFLVLGNVIVAAIYRTGQFGQRDVIYVWGILAGATVGLLASTLGRLYSSTYYALRDTRTPLRYAIVRVILTTILGLICAFPLPHLLGIEARWGAAGLTVSAGISSWVEFLLLRYSLNRRIGATGLSAGYLSKLWAGAGLAAGVGWVTHHFAGHHSPILIAVLVVVPFGVLYFGALLAMNIDEATGFLRGMSKILGTR